MEIVDDEGGKLTKMKKYGDLYVPEMFPGNVKDQLDAVSNMKIRKDDICVSGYPKSGTHWVKEIIRMIQVQQAVFLDEPLTAISYIPMQFLDHIPSPRILQEHLPFKYLPKEMQKGGKIVYLTRNPKDVVVSMHVMSTKLTDAMSTFKGTFNDTLRNAMYTGKMPYGCWFDYVLEWEEVIRDNKRTCDILHLTYEDLKKNLREGVEKIADFMGIKCSSQLLDDIAKKCSFKEMKPGKESLVNAQWKDWTKDGKIPIFNKGEVGVWKDWFTVEQNEIFDRQYAKKMKDSKLKFIFDM